MFSKKNRADKKAIEYLFSGTLNKKEVFFINSDILNLKFCFKKEESFPQIALVIPKNILKRAVDRNFLKRQSFIVLQNYLKDLPINFLGVFIFNKKVLEFFDFKNKNLKNKKELKTLLDKEIKRLLKKTGNFKNEK